MARRAKIIGTVGPASRSPETLRLLLEAGMDVVRLNMSHGTHEQHAAVIPVVRQLAQSMGRAVAVLSRMVGG